ncbi:phosphoribosylformylglycinamidine synthase subunit PurQ [Chloroflexota bacterium]
MHRIEVRLKSHLPDARGSGLVKDIQDLGITTVSDVRVVDIYWFDAELTSDKLGRICQELLSDPVAQEYQYDSTFDAGMVLANELRLKLGGDITRFIKDGGLILGICNGFQALVKAGFLPELSPDSSPRVTLTNNDSGKFECRWVHLAVNKKSPCVFTRGMDRLYVPIAHGEGKIVTLGDGIADSNIGLYYSDELGNITADYPHNPNGSEKNIAGLCDASGRVFGLMPHPEDHIHGTQHPHWTRLGIREYGDGFKIFQNAVEWASNL